MPKTTTSEQQVAPTSAPTELVAGLQRENEKLKSERDAYRRLYLDTLALARKLELGIVGRGREKDLGDATPLSLLALMNCGDPAPAPAAPACAEAEKQDVAAHERKKPTGRKPLPENLPRIEIEVIPGEVQKTTTSTTS